MQMRDFRYTIAGENNPYWLLVEPILLRIWADGIPKASTHFSWIVSRDSRYG